MSGYLLFICEAVHDREALLEYWRGLEAALEGQEAEQVIAYGPFDRLEGVGDVAGVHLLRFPTFDAAKTWHQSAAHEAIKPLAQRGGKFLCAVLEAGRWPDPKDRMPHTVGRSRANA